MTQEFTGSESVDVSTAHRRPHVSVVVPMYNEEANVAELVEEVAEVLGPGPSWELILVDDASTDETVQAAVLAGRHHPQAQVIRLARRYGQSTAMQAGFDRARGCVVVTMDGDLQNDPADIPRLIEAMGSHHDLAVGYRQSRKDGLAKRLPSRVANAMIRQLTGVAIRDNGCSLKAYRASLLRRLRLYSDMHRFIPALAVGVAGARIVELPVHHRARTRGTSKYGLSRIFKVLADLATVKMINSFRSAPLQLFALGTFASTAIGMVFTAAALFVAPPPDRPEAWYVLPSVAFLWFGLAGFLLLTGLLGETILHASPGPNLRGPDRAVPEPREGV